MSDTDTFHEEHRDPTADVILRSRDGILFRAHSQDLARESPFLTRVLAISPPGRPIRLDKFESPTVGYLLEHIGRTRPPFYHILPFDALHDIIKLAKHLGCARIIQESKNDYDSICRRMPMYRFIAASADNDVETAAIALVDRGNTDWTAPLKAQRVPALAQNIRPDWRDPFWRCCLPIVGGKFKVSWPDKARAEQFVEDVQSGQVEMAKLEREKA